MNKYDTWNALKRPVIITRINERLTEHFKETRSDYRSEQLQKQIMSLLVEHDDPDPVVSCYMSPSDWRYIVMIKFKGTDYKLDFDPI